MNKMVWSRLMVIFFIVSSLFFILPTFENNSVRGFGGAGSGTVADPFQITDIYQLVQIADNLTAHYILMNDIDCNDEDIRSWDGGQGWEPLGNNVDNFYGTFNGDNHTISNLYCDRSATDYVGLFGEINNTCIIYNLNLIDVDITGNNNVGGLVGYCFEGIINDSCISGSIIGDTNVGGLVGNNVNFVYPLLDGIHRCFNYAYVYGDGYFVGGLIGKNDAGIVSNSYSIGPVSGLYWVGGLIGGTHLGSITNCYSIGQVTGNSVYGGLVGYNPSGTIVTNCYWDTVTSGQATSAVGIGRTTEQMTYDYVGYNPPCVGLYENWDFIDIWADDTTNINYGYPYLKNINFSTTSDEAYSLFVNCYNESDGNALTFDISIFNEDGTLIYLNTSCDNTLEINLTSDYYNTLLNIIISSNGYISRSYIVTLQPFITYVLNAYLLPLTGNQYLVRIIDEYLYPVDDVTITIKKYLNHTGTWTTLTSFLTDGYGESYVTLLGNIDYKVTVSKTGYNTDVFDWHTDTIYFGPGYPKTFKISHSSNTINASNHFQDYITFTGTMYTNNTIKISYYDKSSTTTNTAIYLYELWNGVKILKRINTTSSNYNFYFWNTSINSSRTYIATLYWNSTTSYDITSPYSITLWPVNNTYNTSLSKIDIDKTVKDVIGPAPNGLGSWASIISVIIAMVLLTTLGPFNAALGIIGAGVGLGLTQALFGIFFTNSLSAGLILLCPFCIVIGIIYFMTKGNVEDKI